MPSAPGHAAIEEYDRQYQVWVDRQGTRAFDLDWRLTHLLWRHRALLRRYSPEGKRVLDFGCMDGIFTLRLQQLGGEAVGYDISPAAIAQAKTFRGAAARPVFTTVPPGPGQFDRIYCNEVLEHVENDSGLIGEWVEIWRREGRWWERRPWAYFWDPDHKREYDEVLLRRTLSPWGKVRLHRYYRSPLRNFVPLRQNGAAVFIFEVTPPSPPGAR